MLGTSLSTMDPGQRRSGLTGSLHNAAFPAPLISVCLRPYPPRQQRRQAGRRRETGMIAHAKQHRTTQHATRQCWRRNQRRFCRFAVAFSAASAEEGGIAQRLSAKQLRGLLSSLVCTCPAPGAPSSQGARVDKNQTLADPYPCETVAATRHYFAPTPTVWCGRSTTLDDSRGR